MYSLETRDLWREQVKVVRQDMQLCARTQNVNDPTVGGFLYAAGYFAVNKQKGSN